MVLYTPEAKVALLTSKGVASFTSTEVEHGNSSSTILEHLPSKGSVIILFVRNGA